MNAISHLSTPGRAFFHAARSVGARATRGAAADDDATDILDELEEASEFETETEAAEMGLDAEIQFEEDEEQAVEIRDEEEARRRNRRERRHHKRRPPTEPLVDLFA